MKHICPECQGAGWYIGSGTSTSYDKSGESICEQVPVQVQCERCYATGEIEDENSGK